MLYAHLFCEMFLSFLHLTSSSKKCGVLIQQREEASWGVRGEMDGNSSSISTIQEMNVLEAVQQEHFFYFVNSSITGS